jgi:hypothetical protein
VTARRKYIFFLSLVGFLLFPSKILAQTSATYKINEVKNNDSIVLSVVKIYVDDVYLHHYAPQTITFCDGCKCDTYVDCGFGEHRIKLEKAGYLDWLETKTFNAGDSFEVNPIMLMSSPTPTNTPTTTFVPAVTNTPTSAPPSAGYKINEVKDKDGNILSSVKVLVDGIYLHHYAPETIIFCDGCSCDGYVSCGFGEHLIELQKSGFKDWEEKKTFSAGNNFEVNPVMEAEETPQVLTPTPTPSTTFVASPTPTKKATPTPTKIATISGTILGEEATEAAFFPLESTPTASITPATQSSGKNTFLAKIFLGLGMLALFGAAFSLWYTRLRI